MENRIWILPLDRLSEKERVRFPGGQMTPVAIATGGKEALARYRSRFHTKSKIPPSGRNYAKHQFGDKSFTFLMEKIIGVAPETPVSVAVDLGCVQCAWVCVRSISQVFAQNCLAYVLGMPNTHLLNRFDVVWLHACALSLSRTHTHTWVGKYTSQADTHMKFSLSLSLTHTFDRSVTVWNEV